MLILLSTLALAGETLTTDAGEVTIHPLRHGTFFLQWGGKTLWVDPWSKAPMDGQPAADIVLITDIHGDHLDPAALAKVRTDETTVVAPQAVADKLTDAPPDVVLANGETKEVAGISVQGVPMYNHTRGPEPGKLYHDKGRGNGYLLTIGGKRIYIAGDTACTDEMKALKNIDVAFVPMNLPYTMPPDEAATCIAAFDPTVLYPYHYRGSDLTVLTKALEGEPVEVRLRKWYDE